MKEAAGHQLSLSGQQDLAEITSPDYPGERLIACRNPVLAADRARVREDLPWTCGPSSTGWKNASRPTC